MEAKVLFLVTRLRVQAPPRGVPTFSVCGPKALKRSSARGFRMRSRERAAVSVLPSLAGETEGRVPHLCLVHPENRDGEIWQPRKYKIEFKPLFS